MTDPKESADECLSYMQSKGIHVYGDLSAKVTDYMKQAWEAGAKAERERCADVVIRATRIPPEAVRRGTGVRDAIVVAGERIADAILNPASGSEEK